MSKYPVPKLVPSTSICTIALAAGNTFEQLFALFAVVREIEQSIKKKVAGSESGFRVIDRSDQIFD